MEGNKGVVSNSPQVGVENMTSTGETQQPRKKSRLFIIIGGLILLIVIMIVVVAIIANNGAGEGEDEVDDDVTACDVSSIVEEYKPQVIDAKTDEEKFYAYISRANQLIEYGLYMGCNVENEVASDLEKAGYFVDTEEKEAIIDEVKFRIYGSSSKDKGESEKIYYVEEGDWLQW